MQKIPEYAFSWRPYSNPNMFYRKVTSPNGNAIDYYFIIDPWTQYWILSHSLSKELLSQCNGRRLFSDIIQTLQKSGGESANNISDLALDLQKRKILFCSQPDHTALGLPVYNKSEIIGLHLEITNACNMTCTHCYVSSGKSLPNEMSMETIYKTIDELPPFSGKSIALSGGEPIVRKGCMDIVEYCIKNCGHDVDLYTNGRRFPIKFAKRIKYLNQNFTNKVRLQVSLEGSTAETNDAVRGIHSFVDTMKSIAMFTELGIGKDVVLFVCLTKHNIHQLDDIIRLAENQEIGMLVFSQWQKQGNASQTSWKTISPSDEEWIQAGEKLLQYNHPTLKVYGNFYGDLNNNEIGRYGLDAPLFPKHLYYYNALPRITPQGNILADQMWVDPTWFLGNVKTDNIEKCFDTPKFYSQLEAMRDRMNHIKDCQQCEWQKLCEGGSPGHTYAEHGHMNEKDLFCETRKYWFNRYLEHQTKKAFSSLENQEVCNE